MKYQLRREVGWGKDWEGPLNVTVRESFRRLVRAVSVHGRDQRSQEVPVDSAEGQEVETASGNHSGNAGREREEIGW